MSGTSESRWRMARAVLAGVLVGAALLSAFLYGIFAAVERNLSEAQISWMRQAFLAHPVWFLLAILTGSAILGLPVLLVALRVARLGPWRRP